MKKNKKLENITQSLNMMLFGPDVACWWRLAALSDAGEVAVAVDVDDNSVQCYQKDQKKDYSSRKDRQES